MCYNLCIPDEEVDRIIELLLSENRTLTRELILKGIKSCCVEETIVRNHPSFIDSVRERVKMFRLM
jgi:hypothetical protein